MRDELADLRERLAQVPGPARPRPAPAGAGGRAGGAAHAPGSRRCPRVAAPARARAPESRQARIGPTHRWPRALPACCASTLNLIRACARAQATQEKVGALMQLAEANKRAKGRASPAAAKQPGGSGWRVRGARALRPARAAVCRPPSAQQPAGSLHGLCVSHARLVMHSKCVRREGHGGGHDPGSQ